MSRSLESTGGRRSVVWLGVLAPPALLFLYLAGIGPAVWLVARYPEMEPAYRAFYDPLDWICDTVPGLRDVLLWWCSFWVE